MDKEKRERSHPSEASILILQVLNWLWGVEALRGAIKKTVFFLTFPKLARPPPHSASKRAHFRHFQSVLETVFFVFSVNLIHILILF